MFVAMLRRQSRSRAVDQKVWNARRQRHHRLGPRAVVIGPERNRRLIDLREELVAQAREPAFRMRIAAALSPSSDPKFPTRRSAGTESENGCAIRTSVS
jgi:hypothetical protein